MQDTADDERGSRESAHDEDDDVANHATTEGAPEPGPIVLPEHVIDAAPEPGAAPPPPLTDLPPLTPDDLPR